MSNTVPSRVRVLIVGGGIHGTGLLHDMASRGWQDVLLVEKGKLGEGTSSKSTKLIHGGLRYLKNIRDFGLVREGLHERKLLIELVPDLVHPIELYFPVLKGGGMPSFIIRSGLYLYDFLAGSKNIAAHKKINLDELAEKMPRLDINKFKKVYSFWDGQTDDLLLTRRVANSARKLGAQYVEQMSVTSIDKDANGWLVVMKDEQGKEHKVSARYVFNAAGPWTDELLKQSNLKPDFDGENIKGSHLILDDIGLKQGLFLQSMADDDRIFFVLPWEGTTLIGTTEVNCDSPDDLEVSEEEVDYLLKQCNHYFKVPFKKSEVKATFAGMRWLASSSSQNMTDTSRSVQISVHRHEDARLYSLYGGKLTAYRQVAKDLGDMICKNYGDETESTTHLKESWAQKDDEDLDPVRRFT